MVIGIVEEDVVAACAANPQHRGIQRPGHVDDTRRRESDSSPIVLDMVCTDRHREELRIHLGDGRHRIQYNRDRLSVRGTKPFAAGEFSVSSRYPGQIEGICFACLPCKGSFGGRESRTGYPSQ